MFQTKKFKATLLIWALMHTAILATYQGINDNFSIFTKDTSLNFNRYRGTFQHNPQPGIQLHLIGDLTSQIQKKETNLSNKLHRAFLRLDNQNNTFILGKQRIALGVGRLWTPSDLINPPNPIAIEPGERKGVTGGSHTYTFNETSNWRNFWVYNEKDTKSFGSILKLNSQRQDISLGYLNVSDQSILTLSTIGELFKTGESIYTEFTLQNEQTTGLLGFEKSIYSYWILSSEFLLTHSNYWGTRVANTFFTLWTPGFTSILNIKDNSYFLAPTLAYSFSQNSDLSLGYLYASNTKNTEFASIPDQFYFQFSYYHSY